MKEIEAVDEALQRHGLADVRVGSVGLERLKKTAQILQVAQNIPTLISLIPFLELTSNQEYLVTRIKGTFIICPFSENLRQVIIFYSCLGSDTGVHF